MRARVVFAVAGAALVAGGCFLSVDSDLSTGPGPGDGGGATDAPGLVDAPAGNPERDAAPDAAPPDAAATGYAAAILADKPAAYWRLDETTGTLAADSSGNHVDATIGPNVKVGTTSLVGDGFAARFDGAEAGFTDFIHRAVSPALQPSYVTVEAWVLADTASQDANLVSYGNDSNEPFEPWVLQLAGGYPSAYVVTTGSGGKYIQADVPMGINTAHYLAMTYDGSALKLYVDAVLASSAPCGPGPLTSYDSNGLGIGNGAEGTRRVLAGVLDEVAIYPTALPPETINKHFAAGRP